MSSGFGEFLAQIPAPLILNLCLMGTLFFGTVFYIFYWRPRQERKKAQAQTDSHVTQPPPAPAVTAAKKVDTGQLPDLDLLVDAPPPPSPTQKTMSGLYQVQLDNGDMTEAEELVIVLRDKRDGRLIVQIGEVAYRTLKHAPDAKKKFVKIMKELSTVVQSDDAPPAPKAKPAKPRKVSTPPAPKPNLEELRTLVEDETPDAPMLEPDLRELASDEEETPAAIPTEPPPPLPDGTLPGDLPSFKLDDQPMREKETGLFIKRKKVEYEPPPNLDIAAAIESYLQYKLQYSPEMAERRLHIHNSPDGFIRIEVDGTFYEAVDDIDDKAVREFLRATIQEWQDRQ